MRRSRVRYLRPGVNTGKRGAVSEVIGALLIIAVAVGAMAIITLALLSGPLPARVPSISAVVTNWSSTIYISHEGGDPLSKGQYRVLVDGVDETSNFDKSFTDPWSVGKVMNYTVPFIPSRIIVIYNGSVGSGTLLFSADLTALKTVPPYLPAMPSIAWTYTPLFGNNTTAFQFTDSSTGRNVTGFYWNFNDGTSPSSNPSPTHSFPSCVTNPYCPYPINHSATDSPGTSWSMTGWLNSTSSVIVYVEPRPNVDFTSNVTSGTVPFAVKFTATSYGAIKVDNWSWNFDGNNVSYLQSPTFTYEVPGTYTVTLTAANYTLGTNTTTKPNLIQANAPVALPWYSCLWPYRKKITLDHAKVAGDLINFPVLISFTDSDLASYAQTSGYDILFTDSTQTVKFPHEIENFTKGTGLLIAWVNVSSLSSATNTTIYMYYGNSTAPNQQDLNGNVWSNGYGGVWHLNQSGTGAAGEYKDSTKNGNNGSGGAFRPTRASGIIGFGQQFASASSQNITVPNSASLAFSGPITVEVWMDGSSWSWPGTGYNYRTFVGKQYSTGWAPSYELSVYDGSSPQPFYGALGGTFYAGANVNTNSWYHVAMNFTGSGGNVYLFLNGTQVGSGPGPTIQSDSNPVIFGGIGDDATHTPHQLFDGIIDEVRISSVARTDTWIKTEVNNQGSPQTFEYRNATSDSKSCCCP
jgi:PKD repeat protein